MTINPVRIIDDSQVRLKQPDDKWLAGAIESVLHVSIYLGHSEVAVRLYGAFELVKNGEE
ncbi:hypothetical protein K7H91_12055 [Martelella mediterranea]|uniref:hypothetical protein n=1 Tax=Martelella mediterranea TaxID=293089 RepID=UPI001E456FDC|nr:hypothetical protein [Martelella mediterranea]MCD1634506.1 hypothetical protein [Martelella mediterranea]